MYNTYYDLARSLETSTKNLTYIVYGAQSNKYIVFDIPKKNGGYRTISAPIGLLKEYQKRLSYQLQSILDISCHIHGHDKIISHAFNKNSSIVTNAQIHTKKKYVFNIDLKDFFGSINFGRVRGYLMKNNHFLLNKEVATIISALVCHNNCLPQGAPTSPVLSNLIAHILDIHLLAFAKKNKCHYSRYADDITFSTNQPFFPVNIAFIDELGIWQASKRLSTLIEKQGFEINPKKTRMQLKNSQQIVTGLSVNSEINVRYQYRNNVRCMVNHLYRFQKFTIPSGKKEENLSSCSKGPYGTLEQLEGYLSFIYYVKFGKKRPTAAINETMAPVRNKRNNGKSVLLPNKILRTIADFYFYMYCIGNTKVSILTEGKTDVVYLKYAIKILNEANIYTATPITILTRNRKMEFLGLPDGGTSELSKFINNYTSYYKRSLNKSKKPVVLLLDHDEGLASFKPEMIQKIKTGESFCHIDNNLYILLCSPKSVFTGSKPPPVDYKSIEDCFEDEVKNISISGKKICFNNKYDTNLYVGKEIFSKHIRDNSRNINFQGFIPILKQIQLIEIHYENYILKK